MAFAVCVPSPVQVSSRAVCESWDTLFLVPLAAGRPPAPPHPVKQPGRGREGLGRRRPEPLEAPRVGLVSALRPLSFGLVGFSSPGHGRGYFLFPPWECWWPWASVFLQWNLPRLWCGNRLSLQGPKAWRPLLLWTKRVHAPPGSCPTAPSRVADQRSAWRPHLDRLIILFWSWCIS